MEIQLVQRQELQLRLAPQLLQSIEILQLATLDLKGLIEREMEANPTLEMEVEDPLSVTREQAPGTEGDSPQDELAPSKDSADAVLGKGEADQRDQRLGDRFVTIPQSAALACCQDHRHGCVRAGPIAHYPAKAPTTSMASSFPAAAIRTVRSRMEEKEPTGCPLGLQRYPPASVSRREAARKLSGVNLFRTSM